MKKYTPQDAKPFLIVTLICGVVLLIGILLAFGNAPNIGLSVGMIFLGFSLGNLFLCCYLAEKSRTLIIDADNIILPRGAEINGKTVFRKTVVSFSEINSLESKLRKGDGLLSKDTNFYTLVLTDSTKITITLYAYGKQAEREILETIHAMIG